MVASRQQRAAIAAAATLLIGIGFLSRPGQAVESRRIIDGSTVTLLYQVTVPDEGRYEVPHFTQFIQGRHHLSPALERLITGLKSGDRKTVVLSVDEGFGKYDAARKKTVPREDLPAGVQEGDILQDRWGKSATVNQLSDGSAVLDYNHPLAGKPLVVRIMVLRVDGP